jgi:putative transposase
VSENRVSHVMMMSRSNCNYQSKRDEQAPLRMRIRDIAAVRVRYGYKRIHILLKREGWQVNQERMVCPADKDGILVVP